VVASVKLVVVSLHRDQVVGKESNVFIEAES